MMVPVWEVKYKTGVIEWERRYISPNAEWHLADGRFTPEPVYGGV